MESLLAHLQIWSRSIEIPTESAKRWLQSLFDMGDSIQEIKDGSELAPSFQQISKGRGKARILRSGGLSPGHGERRILIAVNFHKEKTVH